LRRARPALRILALHQRHGFIPDAGQRLAQRGIGLERGGIDRQQIEDFARICAEENTSLAPAARA
jgi:hypothetical protein